MPKRDEIAQEREKKILVPNSIHTRPGQENSKQNSKKIQKIKKVNFYPKRAERGREREKKISVPYSVHTRQGQENFEKNS